jgi:hypothetical protein
VSQITTAGVSGHSFARKSVPHFPRTVNAMKNLAPARSLDSAFDPAMIRWIHPKVILVATDLSDLDRLIPFALSELFTAL